MKQKFGTYHLLVVFVLPLFFLATTLHHSVDIDNFLPAEQASDDIPFDTIADVLSEISTEDDIHSRPILIDFSKDFFIDLEKAMNGENLIALRIPSPPPDFV